MGTFCTLVVIRKSFTPFFSREYLGFSILFNWSIINKSLSLDNLMVEFDQVCLADCPVGYSIRYQLPIFWYFEYCFWCLIDTHLYSIFIYWSLHLSICSYMYLSPSIFASLVCFSLSSFSESSMSMMIPKIKQNIVYEREE